MNVVWAQIWIVLGLIISTGPALAQKDIDAEVAACRASLTPTQLEPRAQVLAQKLVQASNITDLSMKATALRRAQIELNEFNKEFGATGLKRVSEIATQIQNSKSEKQALGKTQTDNARAVESESLAKWTRLKVVPNFEDRFKASRIAGKTGKVIKPVEDGIEVRDLHSQAMPARKIMIKGLNETSLLQLAHDEKSLIAVTSPDENLWKSNYTHVDLLTGASSELMTTDLGRGTAGFFADGALLYAQPDKPYFIHSPPSRTIQIDTPERGKSFHVQSLSNPNYAALLDHNKRFHSWIDRKEGTLIPLKRRTWDPHDSFLTFANPVYDSSQNRIYFSSGEPGAVSKIMTLNLTTGFIGTVKTISSTLGIDKVIGSGDGENLIVSHLALEYLNPESKDGLFLLNMKTQIATPLEFPDSVAISDVQIFTQPTGPLALINYYDGPRKAGYDEARTMQTYIVDTRNGSLTPVSRVTQEIEKAAFSSDGNRIWLNLKGRNELLELER